MSARQIARLRALVEEKIKNEQAAENEVEEEEEEEEYLEPKSHVSFSALAFSDDSEEDESEEEESEETEEEEEKEEKEEKTVEQSTEEKEKQEMEYLDNLIEEMKQQSQEQDKKEDQEMVDPNFVDLSQMLTINLINLNDEIEEKMKLQNNQKGKKRHGYSFDRKKCFSDIVSPPISFISGGYSIDLIDCPYNFDKGNLIHLDNKVQFASILFSKDYERVENEYKNTLSLHIHDDLPNAIFEFAKHHQYHLRCLLDICRLYIMYGDINSCYPYLHTCMSSVLYSLNYHLQSTLNNMRLLYTESKNIPVYDLFYLYIRLCLRKACYNTSLYTSFLLYSFFPQVDPKGALFYLSYSAIMSKNYPFIKRMIESSISIGPLPLLLLPNFSFDYGYALYQLDQKEEGKQQIKESLKNFPQVLRMLKETGTTRLTISSSIENSFFYAYQSSNKDIELFLSVFITREGKIWTSKEMCAVLVECMKELIEETTEVEFKQIQKDIEESYSIFREYNESLEEKYQIAENLLRIDATNYTDEIPQIMIADFYYDMDEAVLNDMVHGQVDQEHVENNIPMDHNLLQLFLEAMNPEMNANEMNDDDVAAMNEQLAEFLQQGLQFQQPNNDNEDEDGWQQDWDSDSFVY